MIPSDLALFLTSVAGTLLASLLFTLVAALADWSNDR